MVFDARHLWGVPFMKTVVSTRSSPLPLLEFSVRSNTFLLNLVRDKESSFRGELYPTAWRRMGTTV